MSKNKPKEAFIGRILQKNYDSDLNGKLELMGRLEIDFSKQEHTLIVAKSGSGKSYFAGVLAEELIRTNDNYCVVIIDPMGIFSTLHIRNNGKEVEEWNKKYNEIHPTGLNNFSIWIPSGDVEDFDDDMYNHVFSLKASQISDSTLCYAFNLKSLSPQVNLFNKSISRLKKIIEDFSINDLIEYIRDNGKDLHFKDQTIEALITKLDALEELGLITEKGIEINEMVKEGQVIVFDLSMSSDYTARIIVNFFAEKLLKLRRKIKKKLTQAELKDEEIRIHDYIPPTQLVIDEAHNFMEGSKILKKFIKEGRNCGLMLCAISQSPDLTKSVYANISHIFVGQLVFNDDIAKVRSILPVVISNKDFQAIVKYLGVGCFIHYHSSSKNLQFIIKTIKIRPRYTKHPAQTELKDERKYLIQEINLKNSLIKFIGDKTVKISDIPIELRDFIPDLEISEKIKSNGLYVVKRL